MLAACTPRSSAELHGIPGVLGFPNCSGTPGEALRVWRLLLFFPVNLCGNTVQAEGEHPTPVENRGSPASGAASLTDWKKKNSTFISFCSAQWDLLLAAHGTAVARWPCWDGSELSLHSFPRKLSTAAACKPGNFQPFVFFLSPSRFGALCQPENAGAAAIRSAGLPWSHRTSQLSALPEAPFSPHLLSPFPGAPL